MGSTTFLALANACQSALVEQHNIQTFAMKVCLLPWKRKLNMYSCLFWKYVYLEHLKPLCQLSKLTEDKLAITGMYEMN